MSIKLKVGKYLITKSVNQLVSVENSYCFIPNLSSKTEPGKKIWEQQRRLLALGSQVSSHTYDGFTVL